MRVMWCVMWCLTASTVIRLCQIGNKGGCVNRYVIKKRSETQSHDETQYVKGVGCLKPSLDRPPSPDRARRRRRPAEAGMMTADVMPTVEAAPAMDDLGARRGRTQEGRPRMGQSRKVRHGSVRLGSVRYGLVGLGRVRSVRLGSARVGSARSVRSVRYGSVRFGPIKLDSDRTTDSSRRLGVRWCNGASERMHDPRKEALAHTCRSLDANR